MTARPWLPPALLVVALAACRGTPAHAPAPPSPPSADASANHAKAEEPLPQPAVRGAIVEPAAASTTASYEEATSVPEDVNLADGRAQLTDNQLSEPMRGVLSTCRVPPNVRVTIQTAVQYGHAVGVTIHVVPPVRPPKKGAPTRVSKKAAKAEATMIVRVTACADRHVRARTLPPSGRRDSFTTTF